MNRGILDHNGTEFEKAVCQRLRVCSTFGHIIHNKSIYSKYIQGPTQIDVLFVTDKCVYIIECKNWKYWVSGSIDDKYWQGFSSSRKVLSVINIYDQNMLHRRALQFAYYKKYHKFLPIKTLVVFPDTTEIKTDCPELYTFSQFDRAIDAYERRASISQDSMIIKENLEAILKDYSEVKRNNEVQNLQSKLGKS